jgi:hypothetical protein
MVTSHAPDKGEAMKTSIIARVFALAGLCTAAVYLMGPSCNEPTCVPCPAGSQGNACSANCEPPFTGECILEGQVLKCGAPAPCNPVEHCKPPAVCFETTCSFSQRCGEAGVYECNGNVCCKTTPAAKDSACPGPGDDPADPPSWTGTCDGAGVCEAAAAPATKRKK